MYEILAWRPLLPSLATSAPGSSKTRRTRRHHRSLRRSETSTKPESKKDAPVSNAELNENRYERVPSLKMQLTFQSTANKSKPNFIYFGSRLCLAAAPWHPLQMHVRFSHSCSRRSVGCCLLSQNWFPHRLLHQSLQISIFQIILPMMKADRKLLVLVCDVSQLLHKRSQLGFLLRLLGEQRPLSADSRSSADWFRCAFPSPQACRELWIINIKQSHFSEVWFEEIQ